MWLKFFGPEGIGGNEKGIFRELESMIRTPKSEPEVTPPELEGMRIELQSKIDAQTELNVTLDETIIELQEELEKVATGG